MGVGTKCKHSQRRSMGGLAMKMAIENVLHFSSTLSVVSNLEGFVTLHYNM